MNYFEDPYEKKLANKHIPREVLVLFRDFDMFWRC